MDGKNNPGGKSETTIKGSLSMSLDTPMEKAGVKSMFLKITLSHVEYVIDRVTKNTGEIFNIRRR